MFRSRNLPFVVMLATVLVAFLILIPIQTANHATDTDATQNQLQRIIQGWTSNDWVALFTGVLTVATIGTWFVMWRTQRLLAAWAIHALNNGIQFAILYLAPDLLRQMGEGGLLRPF